MGDVVRLRAWTRFPSVKIGDLIHDHEVDLGGIIVEELFKDLKIVDYFSVLYEDGLIGTAHGNALEVISAAV
jgi:hypothetical protein